MPMSADAEPAPGALLLAAPMLQDPNFRRTVILMCEHQPDEGSFGLVLDRPLDVSLGDVMDGVYAYDPSLYLGGPVQRDTLHFLHCRDDIPGSIPLRDGVHWGGDFDVVSQLATAGEASRETLRFFLGYTGWGPGQLEAEMDEEAWIVAPATPDLLFPPSAEGLWNTVLRRMGGEYAYLANFPDDPRMN